MFANSLTGNRAVSQTMADTAPMSKVLSQVVTEKEFFVPSRCARRLPIETRHSVRIHHFGSESGSDEVALVSVPQSLIVGEAVRP